jgi:glycosyltransferase involved in cell wall biosynthesis
MINKKQNSNLIKLIDKEKLDLMIFSSPTNVALCVKISFIFSVQDLQHRINPQFPEVSSKGIWESREYSYRQLCKKAKLIFVDSVIGKEDVIKYYAVNPIKVEVLSYLPPSYLRSDISYNFAKKQITKLGIIGKYIYYPAKFWPHKNHINLIKALNIINKNKKDKISLILTGANISENSTYDATMSYASNNNLGKYIRYFGIVDATVQSSIYKCAEALVMPTFFGPTNIPILEAWKMRTPVIYSNIRGCREQLGDAGLLIDPSDPSDIAAKITRLIKSKILRENLIKKGTTRLNLWTGKEFNKKVNKVIGNFAKI